MGDGTKQCSKCGEWKSLDSFYKWNRCKKCACEVRKEYSREYRNRPEVKKRQKLYSQRPEVRQYQCEYSRCPENRKHKAQLRRQHRKTKSLLRGKVHKKKQLPTRKQIAEIKKYQREYQREYVLRPEVKERRKAQCHINEINRRARKQKLPNTLTADQWQYALNYFNGCCAACGKQLNDMFGEFTAAMDHWIPLSHNSDTNPGTVAENIVPLCHGLGGCNNSKRNKVADIWLEQKFGKRKAKQIITKIQAYFDSL